MKGQRHGYPISALMEFVDYLKSGGRDPIGRESLDPIFEEREDRMKKGTWWGPLPPDKP